MLNLTHENLANESFGVYVPNAARVIAILLLFWVRRSKARAHGNARHDISLQTVLRCNFLFKPADRRDVNLYRKCESRKRFN